MATNLLLHLSLNRPGFYCFVFGGVLLQYNLHYLVKKTSRSNSSHFEWSQKNRLTHRILAGAGFLFLMAGVFSYKFNHLSFLLLLGLITILYSFPLLPFSNRKRLKDFGVVKIFTLVLLWTLVTVWLPVSQTDNTGRSFLLIFAGRFIFLFALCLVFDIRDLDIDAKESIRTLPVIIGIKRTYKLNSILLGIFVLISFIRYSLQPVASHLNAMVLSAGATFIMIKYVRKHKTDIAYLTCLDGMMLLQALLIVIGSI